MRRIGIVILTILLLTLLPAVSARASSPNFITIGADPPTSDLHVFFKEVGLGNTGTINYQVTATAACDSSGSVRVSKTAQFSKNGEVTVPASNPIIIPSPCSGTTTKVTYTDVMVTDCTNKVTSPILPGPFVFNPTEG